MKIVPVKDSQPRPSSPGSILALSCLLLFGLKADVSAKLFRFNVLDEYGQPTAARFALLVNGVRWFPDERSKNCLRFVSYHDSKKQLYVATYATGKGAVELRLPEEASRVSISVAKGFEYRPLRQSFTGEKLARSHSVKLSRWSNLAAEGWLSADAHLHYDRFSKRADPMWFTMMQGDDLASIHFMYLIGGKVPGEWAVQYGYGKKGEANDGSRLITAGLEYRDGLQGHINLLGMPEIVQPVMAGRGKHPNYPTLDSVLRRTSNKGGLPVVAHGGSLGGAATVILDGILGSPDAIEIGNSHLYSLDNWYRLMNAGFFYPPVAGTDLPNFPERDWWQPFLGGMRMYAYVGEKRDFATWKSAVKSGRVMITSGPILKFKVGGAMVGSTLRLPKPMALIVEGSIESPQGVHQLELVQNGKITDIPLVSPGRPKLLNQTFKPDSRKFAGSFRRSLMITNSCWLALRGRGSGIGALRRAQLPPTPYHNHDAIAHSGIVRVIVDNQPIATAEAKEDLAAQLREQQEIYDKRAKYETSEQKTEMLNLFDRALDRLK